MFRRLTSLLLAASFSVVIAPEKRALGSQDASGATAAPPEQLQQPTFRVGIDLVRVDVIVTDRSGAPTTGLTAADFEVFENGKRQDIASFEFVSGSGQVAGNAEPPWPIHNSLDVETAVEQGARIFVIFLDAYHVRRGRNTLQLRDALADFVRDELGPTDLVALMYPFTSIFDLEFTRDRDAIAQEILEFEGRADDLIPRRPLEAEHGRDIRRLRNEVVLTALTGLATHLQGLGVGRKTIILGSEGFIAGGWADSADFYARIQDVASAANRGNTAIYPLDPSGLTLDTRTAVEPLRVLASETTGVALVSRNDLPGALSLVSRDSSGYYLIGYYPSDVTADGKWREIDVRARRRGLELRARKGYAALTAAEMATKAAPIVEPSPEALHALTALGSPVSGRAVGTWIGYEANVRGGARVRFVWERSSVAAGPVQVSITATAADQTICFKGPVRDPAEPSSPSAMPALEADAAAAEASPGVVLKANTTSAAGQQVVFDVPAGQLVVMVDVEAENLTSRLRLTLDVPDSTTTALAIDTPRIVRTYDAREYKMAREDPEARPVTTRDFRRTERLLVRFGAHGTAAANATVAASLLNRRGEKLVDLPAATVRALGEGRYEIDLPLASFAAGEFLLQIRASAGGAHAKETVALRIIA